MSSPSSNFSIPVLDILQDIAGQRFQDPLKQINEGQDVSIFLQSKAYRDIMIFLLQLNRAMFPSKSPESNKVQAWQIGSSHPVHSKPVRQIQSILQTLNSILTEAPPDPGPRRFGNMAFRKYHEILTEKTPNLFSHHLPTLPQGSHIELSSYFLGSFGSAQRLDYGSGHELSFLAFLGCLWKLSFFSTTTADPQGESRGIVMGIIQPYFELIRRLIKTYSLEPAGSHGVWGLDDHSFLPYIFGSAQYGPPITPDSQTPTEGSLDGAPSPGDVAQAAKAARQKDTNMYFSAISFIHEVKRGPFWEHSPMLYDISGVRGGWGKTNKGMIKMYNAEVLSKFPVVQHFRFGELFSWERDPDAPDAVPPSVHVASQPAKESLGGVSVAEKGVARGVPTPQEGTKAPWATGAMPAAAVIGEGTKAPWAVGSRSTPIGRAVPSTRVSGAERRLRDPTTEDGGAGGIGRMPPPTRAPWAKPA